MSFYSLLFLPRFSELTLAKPIFCRWISILLGHISRLRRPCRSKVSFSNSEIISYLLLPIQSSSADHSFDCLAHSSLSTIRTVRSVFQAVSQPPIAALADNVGRVETYMLCVFLYTLGTRFLISLFLSQPSVLSLLQFRAPNFLSMSNFRFARCFPYSDLAASPIDFKTDALFVLLQDTSSSPRLRQSSFTESEIQSTFSESLVSSSCRTSSSPTSAPFGTG